MGVVVVLGVFIAVTWAAGGLRAAPKPVPAVKTNAWIDQGRFRIKVIGARTGRIDHGFGAKTNSLAVRVLVTNMGQESVSSTEFQRSVTARSRPTKPENPATDNKILVSGLESWLHPRMPTQADLFWDLPNGTVLPRVIVTVRMYEYVEDPFGGSDPYWSLNKELPAAATVTLPVQQGATS